MRLNLEALLILDALDRHGTFAAAAARLFKTASALSYTVQKMEGDMKITLLDRSGHRATFTPTGRLMLEKGRALLRAVNELEQQARYVESGWESNLTISVDASVPFSLLSPLIDEFYQQHPHTQLQFRQDVLAGCWEALSYGEADLVFGAVQEPATRKDIGCVALGWLDYVFAVAPSHPLAQMPEPLLREQIRQYRAVTVHDSSRHGAGVDLRVLDEQKTLSVHDFHAKLQAQLAGLGCGYLPGYLAAPHLADGTLVARRLDSETRRDMAYMAWNESAGGNAARWWRERLQTLEGLRDIYAAP
ncbi:MAG: LysR substrate-binding domain-containing protein [Pantoea sp.]|uniref:LysR substrate-binding domain-containing protein n=1 Tax=Pantoea TaxID=53335 RepID=UPI00066084C7|nr:MULTISPECIES: LysR substrate-binding domain-containing protein [Pantoea]MBS6438660.1 LysR family transcriptional regulator [Pantoea sp.]MDU1574083.1 LysR substrate-binding domain-containing protein [Pantoea sp.]MDU2731262.1 LysR substrate-binding domain-containing protein [Pantoea sp.]MDU5475371.1 LysR substrate-binding domain-containing protein [Pantoea sp.]MDU7838797.1 LysR substrate-binding domain-containing protein [Pantoea sp.]